ncbi:ABC transporter substrate-binding protein [Kineothrix sp. MB12-C1]|uniref:ABC transporter substrate-binding protein n=1 Tax=Kineothrix sp. MB12-C1 TaxID=3070215 RepID=UPI0027D20E0A|nr:ABC transporter substrate-binding protein [Kineothrix sp. MB12-C1]WMC93620.1 ABC transporter substrate-binding protein [Kineothrix sp. MB12-C1]
MKLKRLTALLLAGTMALSLAACGGGGTSTTTNTDSSGTEAAAEKKDEGTAQASGDKIVVWTLAEDLKQFAERYTEETGNEVEVLVIAPADYSTKLTSALGAKSSEVDVIVGEPQMIPNFFEAGFFDDLTQYNVDDYKDSIMDYIYEAGKDESGIQRALSYQVTPGSIIYRRDLAKEMFGNDDPAFISEKFKDFGTILETAREVKDAGYRLFSDSGNLRWYVNTQEPWVKDGVLNLSQSALDYMDSAVALYQEDLVAHAPEWSAAWYASMAGELPLNAGWTDLAELEGAEMTQVFSYSLPSWGALIIRDNAADNKGNFGICKGPSSYFGGGTFLGINSYSEKKDAAWEFVKYCTLNDETAQWWLEKSNGDVVSNLAVLEANKDYTNESFGGQNTYEFYMEEAKNIDYSVKTKYDDQIGNFWGSSIEAVQKGEMTREEAIEDFYMQVETNFPEITVTR